MTQNEIHGNVIKDILVDVEKLMWMKSGEIIDYGDDGFRASTVIFMTTLMDRMWVLQEKEDLPIEDRKNMGEKVGHELRKLVKTFTDIDTFNFYNDESKY
jgi:hypothetical protein